MTDRAGQADKAPRCVPEEWEGREKLREAAGKNVTASNLLIIHLDTGNLSGIGKRRTASRGAT